MEHSRQLQVGKRRATPIPVAPPRIPTPMPSNNNNGPRDAQPSGLPVPSSRAASQASSRIIAKNIPQKPLDNDVKTAWINPRLISKIDMEMIKRTDYIPTLNVPIAPPRSGHHSTSNPWPLHQRPTGCGRVHDRDRERNIEEKSKRPQRRTSAVPVPTPARCAEGTRSMEASKASRRQAAATGAVAYRRSACYAVSSTYNMFAETRQFVYAVNNSGANGQQQVELVQAAQSSAAAAFFARAAQKLNLTASPHRRKRYNSDESDHTGFCGAIQKYPPPVPPALLRRIGVREVTGVGKVKVMLRVANPSHSNVDSGSPNSFFSLDKRKKQVTLLDPSVCSGNSAAPEDRRVGVAAPKMFAFDAIFSQDDSQSEVCSSALTDVIHAVINGTDGCLFCFGHAGLGKSYTMLGTPDSANSLGIIPCAISWLFKGISEQKQKTGARFSVRVSAVEVSGPTNQLRDLLAGYSNEQEQSPGVYLRDEPLQLGGPPPSCELRAPTAERAAHYLDAAVESRTSTSGPSTSSSSSSRDDSHLLFTLHVYQYSVAGKGGVAGGRSRLHLIDLGNPTRAGQSLSLSAVGNVLLAIFNGQKHLPHKEHRLTQLLRDCLGSLTCHAAMVVHVSPLARHYVETLTTVQLAARIHRMRRRRIKFVSTAAGNGSGGSSGEEATRTTGTSSEPDPSSSDLSADTVIYVGPSQDDATDGEHPPVYIPSLNSGDNRCSMSKALRGSSAEQRPQTNRVPMVARIEENKTPHRTIKQCQSNKTSPAHTNSPKSSPSRIPSIKNKAENSKHQEKGASDEQWIDGPRISKSKVAEARHMMKEPCHVKKRETWIDGPMQAPTDGQAGYGYMDSHKKNMIRKWVEHQTSQIVRNKYGHPIKTKELTQFKSCDEDEQVIRPLDAKSSHEIVEESVIRTGLKMTTTKSDVIHEEDNSMIVNNEEEQEDEEDEPEIPPALPLIQPLSSREVSLESLDMLLKERMMSNTEYNSYQNSVYEGHEGDGEEMLEIIEVEEPLEPVPTQDSCLQVTEEDIALCMGFSENPLPEVDQENPLDHPLRILSQENLTVVSTFTDSMSVYTDLERILPRHRYERYGAYNDDYEDPDNPYNKNGNLDETTRRKFDQLAKLHELYSNRLAKANVANSETYQKQQKANQRVLTRCESLTLTDMLYGTTNDSGAHDNSSIYSEPAYIQEKFCENCKINMSRPATAQNWYETSHLSSSTQDLTNIKERFQKYSHKYTTKDASIAFLRHPDGASNPNLPEATMAPKQPSAEKLLQDSITCQPLPPPTSLPSAERMKRAILSLETGVTAVKLTHKSEGYDSGHDSTPRTSKHSPAAMSRRAESGYDSVVRDSESSSIDSEPSRMSHLQGRRGKCKHKHEKSFCSWFLNPFTCKYIDEPPETHF